MIKCEECGRILNLLDAITYTVQEGKGLRGYYFCSKEHLGSFAKKIGLDLETEEL